ncbi:MAG: OmpA family protein, partial [Methylococcaceae bacterium]|nr:OmpA family protein [Methylococcaceae bacterium]
MNHSLLWLMMSAAMLGLTQNIHAEESCPTDDQERQQQCEHPEWREQAAMSDNSQVRYADVAENTEQALPQATVTLWALPPVPTLSNTVYSDDEIRHVQLDITTPSPQFTSAKADLDGDMIKRVASLVEQLKDKTGVRLHITGHTDSQGLSVQTQRWFKDNQALSEARAQAVANYFQKALGLSEGAITISGMGAHQPIASNATPSGMTKNRRVDVAIWYDEVTVGKSTTISVPVMNRQQICAGELQSVAPVAGGFRVSVDGQPTDNGGKDSEDVQRCTDVALAKTDIRLSYDNLSAKPMLDGSAWPATAQSGEVVTFQAYSNYLAWIDRAEVRIFSSDRSVEGQALAIIALDDAMKGEWTMSADAPREMQYVIRVYDTEGRYDQTTALPLSKVVEHNVADDDQLNESQLPWAAYGKSRLEQQNIAISGGSITVHGQGVPAEHKIVLMGQVVPADVDGKFVSQQIVPRGQHTIEVAALNQQGDGELFWRDIELKKDDWFYVGIIDVTAGRYHANGSAQEVTQDRHLDNSHFVDGRLAFYTKGKWREKYTVTASADTREQQFSQLFSTIMDKDPRSLLRRLDDTAYYPTYGDDSTLVEDAPTQGKFYAKIEDERSHAMWGNFKIVQQETDLAQINRGLYGAVIDWN